MPIACINPGHNSYGEDTGAQAPGYKEQDLALDILRNMFPLTSQTSCEMIRFSSYIG